MAPAGNRAGNGKQALSNTARGTRPSRSTQQHFNNTQRPPIPVSHRPEAWTAAQHRETDPADSEEMPPQVRVPGTEGWYAPINVVSEAMPEYVEQTSQDAALAQALQAEYDAALCHPQAAATPGAESVENPNSSQAQSPPFFELDFKPAPTRSNKHNQPSAQSSAHGTPAQVHSSNLFAVLVSDPDQPTSSCNTSSNTPSTAGSPHPAAIADPHKDLLTSQSPAGAAAASQSPTGAAPASHLASPPAAISTDPALLVISPPADLQPLPSPTFSPRSNGTASAADAVNDSSISPSTFVQAEPESAAGGATATQGAAMSADPATGTTTTGSVPSDGAELHHGSGIGAGGHDGAGSASADHGGANRVAGVGGAGFGGVDNGGTGTGGAVGAAAMPHVPALPPTADDPYARQDVAPLVLLDNGGGSLEQLHQEVRGLKRSHQEMQSKYEEVLSDARSCKQAQHETAVGAAYYLGRFVPIFEDIHSEAEFTENHTNLVVEHLQQAGRVMHGAAEELVQNLAGPMQHLLMAQRNNVQNWKAVAKLFAQMQQAAATSAQE